ncbi:MAG: aldehyde dehydrogenase family protein, partial [Bacteroidetes bacterium]|nr:aldehyde dehydrogenase family protein [Bacteroidota bacterium]
MPFVSQNPFTGEKYFEREFINNAEINTELKSAKKLFEKWKNIDLSERIALISLIASYLRKNETTL